ncbi:NT3_3 [Blepharisma stoltei]|uniref:Uncharacterized protein n=1 Tax=Blepharisma stoltei TaxID=1481888 RepID=A0AAU9JRK2_9CILI|nr:unnamed protein product [Blepharisma stoltei]
MVDWLFKIEIFLQGVGILVGWSALFASFDFFNAEFPHDQPSFIFPALSNVTAVILQPLVVFYGYKFSYIKRISINFSIIASILVISPILAHCLEGSFPIICILIMIMGISSSISQTSVFEMVGNLPSEYTNYVMIGSGLIGVFMSIFRMICLISFSQDKSGYFAGTLMHFFLAAFILFICIFAQLHLIRQPFMVGSLDNSGKKITWTKFNEESDQMQNISAENRDISFKNFVLTPKIEEISNKTLLCQIWQPLFLAYLCNLVTQGMLIGVALATNIKGLPYSYFSTLMVVTCNIFDFLGRLTPRFYILSIKWLWIITVSRFLFWATFILIATGESRWFFSYPWFKFINMAAFAYSSGYTSTCAMVIGPTQVQESSKSRAGAFMSLGLIYGIVSGSLLALAFKNIEISSAD